MENNWLKQIYLIKKMILITMLGEKNSLFLRKTGVFNKS